ncbi:hypothetical protein HDU97_005603 [Phlyctochytrium planicorne]|nr:hypothetical protein HDU97_005603 [Phlyctochytrium planicorne]
MGTILIVVAPVAYLLAVILSIAATSTPFWYQVVDNQKYTRNLGFFVSQTCWEGACVRLQPTDDENVCGNLWRQYWGDSCKIFDGVRAMLVMANITGLVGIPTFIFTFIRRGSLAVKPFVISTVLVSGLVALLTFTAMCLSVQFRGVEAFKLVGAVNYGGSFVMVVISWMLAVVSAVSIPFTYTFLST